MSSSNAGSPRIGVGCGWWRRSSEFAPNAPTPLLELPEPVDFVAGQYYLVRMRIDGAPGFVEQAYSVSSSPWPPSSKIEITIREIPDGRASPLLAHLTGE